ncbi:MAG: hypothetical protein KDA81_22720, partial [Planctomycetaceae bacterium]|nr:hypothetical protein [Planctomycetaceae bacterium]
GRLEMNDQSGTNDQLETNGLNASPAKSVPLGAIDHPEIGRMAAETKEAEIAIEKVAARGGNPDNYPKICPGTAEIQPCRNLKLMRGSDSLRESEGS